MSAGSFDDSIICLLHLVTALYSSESLYANYMSGSIVDYLKWVSRPSQRSFLASDSFIHSFILAISIAPLQVLYYSEALPTTAQIVYRSFTPKRTGNSTVGKGLDQGPYVAARAGVEPTTFRLKVIASTNAPPRQTGTKSVRGVLIRCEMLYQSDAIFSVKTL